MFFTKRCTAVGICGKRTKFGYCCDFENGLGLAGNGFDGSTFVRGFPTKCELEIVLDFDSKIVHFAQISKKIKSKYFFDGYYITPLSSISFLSKKLDQVSPCISLTYGEDTAKIFDIKFRQKEKSKFYKEIFLKELKK